MMPFATISTSINSKLTVRNLLGLLVLSQAFLSQCAYSLDCSIASDQQPCFDTRRIRYTRVQQVKQGDSLELQCPIKRQGEASVAWLKGKNIISINEMQIKKSENIQLDADPSQGKFSLILSNIESAQNGSYTCQIIASKTTNLDYMVDVLVAPQIKRTVSDNVITLDEGKSITIKCQASGNPQPKLTWTKKGRKAEHTTIDDTQSTLSLTQVDKTHADTYACTAANGVGDPVTSEFQILVRYKPELKIMAQENMNGSVLYTREDRKEVIVCKSIGYPEPKMQLFYNDEPMPSENVIIESHKDEVSGQAAQAHTLTYSFVAKRGETLGNYLCLAENELGSASAHLSVSDKTSEVTIVKDQHGHLFADAILFEWIVLSGSPVHELNVQIFYDEFSKTKNATNKHMITKTRKLLPDGSHQKPTYFHNDAILYKDYYHVPRLVANSTYVVRMRVRNAAMEAGKVETIGEEKEWSAWSKNLTLSTHSDKSKKLGKHRIHQMHRHRKHKNYAQSGQSGSRDLNAKNRQGWLGDFNSASTLTFTPLNLAFLGTAINFFFLLKL